MDAGFVLGHAIASRFVYLFGAIATRVIVTGVTQSRVTGDDVGAILQPYLERIALHGDGGWYLTIVRSGYDAQPFTAATTHNWAFFPLFPGLVSILGGSVLAGVVLSNAAFLTALFILRAETAAQHGRRAARWAVLLLAYWPFSHVFSLFRPESLLLLASLGAWALARRDRWALAWMAVAVATLARPAGMFAAILVLGEIARARPRRLQLAMALVPIVLPVIALAAFSAYLGGLTGDVLAWAHAQSAWGRAATAPLSLISHYLAGGGSVIDAPYDITFLNAPAVILAAIAGVWLIARRRLSEGLFVLGHGLLSPLTGGTLISSVRYTAVAFPLHVLLAEDRALRRFRLALLIAFAVTLALVGAWLVIGSRAVVA
jgi:hypothetical protein